MLFFSNFSASSSSSSLCLGNSSFESSPSTGSSVASMLLLATSNDSDNDINKVSCSCTGIWGIAACFLPASHQTTTLWVCIVHKPNLIRLCASWQTTDATQQNLPATELKENLVHVRGRSTYRILKTSCRWVGKTQGPIPILHQVSTDLQQTEMSFLYENLMCLSFPPWLFWKASSEEHAVFLQN